MSEENDRKDLQNVSDRELKAELEQRVEKKYESWGKDVEGKISAFTRKIPKPVSAFLDALCICVIIAGGAWVFKKFNWINQMPSRTMLGIIFCAIFVISLIYRLIIEPRYRKRKG